MELIIPITIYILTIAYIISKQLTGLFRSKSSFIKRLAFLAAALFSIYLLWFLIPFFRNENEKSFTTGWFALVYFLAVSFTIFAIVAWGLRLIERKI